VLTLTMTRQDLIERSVAYRRLYARSAIVLLLALSAGAAVLPIVSAPAHTTLQMLVAVWFVSVGLCYYIFYYRLRSTRSSACPHCGESIDGYFAKRAISTGRCEHCGSRISEDAP
jgi:hypothetical protein